MYVGLGDDSTTDLSGAFAEITGAATPSCDPGYTYSNVLSTCVSNKGICTSGYSYDVITGVCKQATGITAWLSTGNNALYAGLAVAGLALLMGFAGGRR